ncbi:MAG TPA: hypothetical protein VNV65_08990 [Candidatus Solibacter sp.]|jgi:hypothetical protein|nr:hypothetical protein [Candidatus Solibacter sp.]
MSAAAKILIVGGVLNLAAAFVLGYVLSNKRLNPPNQGPFYLNLAHKNALQEGYMLLGLTWAVTLAHIGSTWLTVAAWLIVASSVFQVGSAVLAWRQGTVDEFKERSPSFYLATTNAILVTAGLAILVYGVLVSL